MNKIRETFIGFLFLLRPNRTIMVSVIAGTGAFVSGAGAEEALWMALVGWLLAVGGFSLDYYADRDLDKKGMREKIRKNPIANGMVSPSVGLIFSIVFLIISLVALITVNMSGIFAWIAIVCVLIGLALHIFETPISRAFTLGILQALYFLMGGSIGGISPVILILSAMFFFAMFGGRGLTDIRDFQQDLTTRVQTFPVRYGLKTTLMIIVISLCLSFLLSYVAFLTGEFSRIYLYLDIAFIFLGLICIIILLRNPTSQTAAWLTPVFMMGEGTIISLAMILGSKTF